LFFSALMATGERHYTGTLQPAGNRITRHSAKRASSRQYATRHGLAAFSSLANLALTGVDAILVVFLIRTVGLSSAADCLVIASIGPGGVLGALAPARFGTRNGAVWAPQAGMPRVEAPLTVPVRAARPPD
jgi:hypothetical protein